MGEPAFNNSVWKSAELALTWPIGQMLLFPLWHGGCLPEQRLPAVGGSVWDGLCYG